jgi:hypothetical protein
MAKQRSGRTNFKNLKKLAHKRALHMEVDE